MFQLPREQRLLWDFTVPGEQGNLLSRAGSGAVSGQSHPPSLTDRLVMPLPRLQRLCCCQVLALPSLWQGLVSRFLPPQRDSRLGCSEPRSWELCEFHGSAPSLLPEGWQLPAPLQPPCLGLLWEGGMCREGFAWSSPGPAPSWPPEPS